MNTISITSDRQSGDFFLGRVKGEIAKTCPNTRVIDLAYNLPVFDITYASFVIKHSYSNFPDGTIHLIGVDSEEGPGQGHLIAKAYNQYFICADNGLITLIFDADEITSIHKALPETKPKTPALIRFVGLAKNIIFNTPAVQYLLPVENYVRKLNSRAVLEETLIMGTVIYVDSYLNAITNISKDEFQETAKGREFTIFVGSIGNKISKINTTRIAAGQGELVAIFNSLGLLEISINRGQAVNMLDLKPQKKIRIEFHDSQ